MGLLYEHYARMLIYKSNTYECNTYKWTGYIFARRYVHVLPFEITLR